MCYTYDKSKGGDTRELQSRMVPPQKKLSRVTLNASHATPQFWREMQMETHQARQIS